MEDFKAAFLEDWMDTIEALPCELQRNFSLIRELDAASQNILRAIEEKSHDFIEYSRESSSEERILKLRDLDTVFTNALKHGEEKVNLAIQTYDLVDRHIRRLDADLVKFEDELTMTGPATHIPYMDSSSSAVNVQSYKRSAKVLNGDKPTGQPKRKRANTGTSGSRKSSIPSLPPPPSEETQRAPVNPRSSQESDSGKRTGKYADEKPTRTDPNEPTYCICNSVSYGAMIACDNPNCEIEWFHYECVGLDSPPKGKWYCQNCRKDFT